MNNYRNPFDSFYDDYSIRSDEFIVPSTGDIYKPDNLDDFECFSVIVPNHKKNAKKTTLFGKVICIGLYRDEGRNPQKLPEFDNCQWIRLGTRLVIQTNTKNHLRFNDEVIIKNSNLPEQTKRIKQIHSDTILEVETLDIGGLSGNNIIVSGNRIKNFEEENIVFRLLPSYKLLKIAEVEDLLQEKIKKNIKVITINDIVTGLNATESFKINKFDTISIENTKKDNVLYSQSYDENNKALNLEYKDNGQPIDILLPSSKYANNKKLYNAPMSNEIHYDNDLNRDSFVYVYDFYGRLINDKTLRPYSSDMIIFRNPEIDNFKSIERMKRFNVTIYNGKIFDRFGNLVIGIQKNNCTISRLPILPLALDHFYKPIKVPFK